MIPRLMRAAIVVSAAAAIACQTELGARSFPHLIPLNVTLFLVAAAAGRWAPQAARWTVFLPSCLFPAMLLVAFGHFDPAAYSVWMAAVLGLIVGTTGVSRWSLPPSWAWPLALWGLCVAGSWSIIAWRELDYTLSQLSRDITSVTSIGIPPAIEIVWIANVAATHLIGILWIDALCRMNSSERPEQGIRRMLGPFLVSVTASAAVGVYQMFGHVTVLNESIFGGFGRASGAMVDGNAFGMLTALWIAGAAIVGWSGRARWMRVAAVLATATLVTATWASGSRTALFVAAVIVIGVVYGAWRAARRTSWRVAAVVALTAVVLAGAVWVTRQGSVTVSPLARLSLTLDAAKSSGGVLATLWRRDGYGTVATAMIRRFPWTGVGVGMFNTFLIDQSRLIGLLLLEPDNAQNWFRHQFAETGVIGSLGWIFWLVVFLPSLFKKPPPDVPVAPLYILRAAIVGLGLASLVAMPTQNVVGTPHLLDTRVLAREPLRRVVSEGRRPPGSMAVGGSARDRRGLLRRCRVGGGGAAPRSAPGRGGGLAVRPRCVRPRVASERTRVPLDEPGGGHSGSGAEGRWLPRIDILGAPSGRGRAPGARADSGAWPARRG